MKKNRVEFPLELRDFEVEEYIFSPVDDRFGIAVLSESHGQSWDMRIYQLLERNDSKYHFVKELEAFSFPDRNDFEEFLKALPSMSALELMMVMNSHTPEYEFTPSSN